MAKVKTIQEQFSDVFINPFDESQHERIIRTTLGLDMCLSGGIPEGCVINIGGKPKSGKTTLILHILAQAQRQYGKKCYYFDVEGRLRPTLLKCIDGLVWTEEQEKETGIPRLQIIRSVKGNFLSAEKFINIADGLATQEENIIMVLDSIAMLCTEDAFSKGADEGKKMAAVPAMMYPFLRKMAQILPPQKSNLITITHIQSDMSRYGSGIKEVGGNAVQYQASIRLQCLSSPAIPKDSEPKIGQDAEFKCTASALGPPNGKATIPIRYGRGVDTIEDLITIGIQFGYIEQTGAWYKFQNQDGEEIKSHGRNGLYEHLLVNTDDKDYLESAIRTSFLGG